MIIVVFRNVSEDGLAYTAVRGQDVANALARWDRHFVASYVSEEEFYNAWPGAPKAPAGVTWTSIEWDEPPRTLLVVEREEDASEEMLAFIEKRGFDPIEVIAPPQGQWTLRWEEELEERLDRFLASDGSFKGDKCVHRVIFTTCRAIGPIMRLRYREGYADGANAVYGTVQFLARDAYRGYFFAW